MECLAEDEDGDLCHSQDGPCFCGLDEGHGGRHVCRNCGEEITVRIRVRIGVDC